MFCCCNTWLSYRLAIVEKVERKYFRDEEEAQNSHDVRNLTLSQLSDCYENRDSFERRRRRAFWHTPDLLPFPERERAKPRVPTFHKWVIPTAKRESFVSQE
jgi:hypothetical protein